MVTVLPLIEQMDGVEELKVTALPEAPPVALTVSGGSPRALFPKAAKEIVWSALVRPFQ
jgi:hypothetical protein